MKKTARGAVALGVLGLLGSRADTSAPPIVIVNDTFADGDRTTQAPPDSIALFKAQATTAASVAPGSATFTWGTTSADMLFGYFTPAGAPVSLAVGDTLTVRLTFAFTGLNPTAATAAPSPQLRFGVFDSQGTREAADSTGTNRPAYAGDTGYALFAPFSAAPPAAAAFDLRRRTTLTATNLFNTAADFTSLAAGGTGQTLTDGVDYTLTYRIHRASPTDTVLSAGVTGGALPEGYGLSTTETSSTPLTTFDYFIWRVSSTNFAAALTLKAVAAELEIVPPTITTQPSSVAVAAGATVVLTAAAAGTPPLAWQWSKDGTPIGGATGSSLTLFDVQPSDAGDYTFTATNAAGSAASDPATLTVTGASGGPVITSPPVSQSVSVGDDASFSVVATGAPPLSYQWLKDGLPVPDATEDTLALTSVALADAGVYTVTVTDPTGTARSGPAALNVTAPGTLGLVSDSFADGDRTTFAPPASVAWFKAQGSTAVTVAPGAATFTWATTSADMLFAYLAPSGAPVSLGVGDTLTVRLAFAFTGLSPTPATAAPNPQLRFGILDSKGTRVAADNVGTGNAAYIGDTGYALFTPFSSAAAGATAFDLRRRTTITSNNVFNTAADFTTLGAGGASQVFANATDYTLTYAIARLSANQTRLSASVTGAGLGDAYAFSTTETSPSPETAFDYFAWRVGSVNFAAALTFRALAVELSLTPPEVTAQPAGQAAREGDTVVLSAGLRGSAPLTLQWSKDGAPIPGATGPSLTLGDVRVADSGDYTLTARNAVGVVTSDPATVSVALRPPAIVEEPQSQTILVGDTYVAAVMASGSEPLAYQWRKDGADIAGASGSTFTLPGVQLTDAGDYDVLVSNGAGSVASPPATLVVTTTPVPPAIIQPPASLTVVAGAPAAFTVRAFGSTPLSYQWSKDGAPIPGATGTLYAIPGATPAHAGSYTVAVTNAAGSATSDPGHLTVIVPPAITTQPVSVLADAGQPASFAVEAAGTAPLAYQWRKNGVNVAGATGATLALASVRAADAGAYSVAVSNAGGAVTSDAATLTVADPALTVTSLFPAAAGTGACIDTPLRITFAVAPTLGTSGLIRIHDAATGVVADTIDLAAATQAKTIGGAVYNYFPVIVSGKTALITPHLPLAYGKAYYATVAPGVFRTASGVFAGLLGDSAWRFGTRAAGPAAGATSLVVATDGSGDFCSVQGAIDFVPAGNTSRRLVSIRKGLYQEMVRIANKPLLTLRGEDRKQTVIAYANNATFNPSVRGVLIADTNDTTLENLTVRNLTPRGGSQAEAVRLSGLRSIVRDCDLTSFQDTVQLNTQAYVENSYIEGDVDFLWGTAAAYFVNSELKAVTAGYYVQARNLAGQSGFVFVDCRLSGRPGLAGIWLARIDPSVFPGSQVVYIRSAMGPHVNPVGWLFNHATGSDTVRFWEHGSTDLFGDPLDVSQRHPSSRQLTDAEAAQWSDPAFVLGGWTPETLPAIHTPPADQTASAGQDVAFSVEATGRPAPTYQWLKDGVALAGATAPTLLLPAVQAPDAGAYSVVVANTAGLVTSSAATLTVVDTAGAPVIITPPASLTVAVGDAASFSVVAGGAPVLAYQWHKNGAFLLGATGPSLSVPAVQLSDAGSYAVRASNGAGSAVSLPAVLAVNATPIEAAPVVLTQPSGRTAIVGDTVTLTVVGRGVPTPSYQWRKDGDPVPGATGSSLTLANVQPLDAGAYSVVLTNPIGTATSADARLMVLRRGRLGGLTARGEAGLRDELLTLRFVIEGAAPKAVLVRAAGPALLRQGVLLWQRDPRLFVRQGTTVVAQNDNWGTAAGDIPGVAAAVGAIPFARGSKDAALLATLPPGPYTVDVDGGLGIAQAEVYEVPGSDPASRLVTGDALGYLVTPILDLEGGIEVGGDTPVLLLVRALGPALSPLGLLQPMPDPQLTLFSGSQVVASNDDWGSAGGAAALPALFARAGASPLPAGSRDAALAVTLNPGRYRARVAGHLRTPLGLARLEVFEVAGLILTAQPQSQTAHVGSTVTLGVAAIGAAPLRYQWRKNGADLAGATSAELVLANVQPTDAGLYSVLVSNVADEVVSDTAILTLTSPTTQLPPIRTFDLEGFAGLGGGVTGGGPADPADPSRYKVIDESTPSPAQALREFLESPEPLVIELRTDVDLGALNNQSRRPLINPELIQSNLGVIRVGSHKTLISSTGATLRHGSLSLDGSRNVILRNLRFRGLWEWDDATQGAYDLQGWDYLTLTNGARNVWIDHCDFGKAYDGTVDVVRGSDLVTVSWTRFSGETEGEVARQMEYLEELYQASPGDPRIAYYRSLRQGGQPAAQILQHEIPQDKGNLVGNDDGLGAVDTGHLNVTLHHDAYVQVRQRTPRLRFGNAHVYNLFVDDSASAPFPGTQTAVNSTTSAAVLVENSSFLEVRTPLQFSSGGRVTQRGSTWQVGGASVPFDPARLNPVNPDDLVWNAPLGFPWPDLQALPYPYTLDPAGYVEGRLGQVGVIVAADAADQALLLSYLLMTRH